MNVAFTPLEKVTSKAEQIYQKAKATVEGLDKHSIAPGLLDQFEIQLERLRPGNHQAGPGCEYIMTPGLLVAPSKRYQISL
jgi:hypothetical protein